MYEVVGVPGEATEGVRRGDQPEDGVIRPGRGIAQRVGDGGEVAGIRANS